MWFFTVYSMWPLRNTHVASQLENLYNRHMLPRDVNCEKPLIWIMSKGQWPRTTAVTQDYSGVGHSPSFPLGALQNNVSALGSWHSSFAGVYYVNTGEAARTKWCQLLTTAVQHSSLFIYSCRRARLNKSVYLYSLVPSHVFNACMQEKLGRSAEHNLVM